MLIDALVLKVKKLEMIGMQGVTLLSLDGKLNRTFELNFYLLALVGRMKRSAENGHMVTIRHYNIFTVTQRSDLLIGLKD